jgi:hypothetical protein
MNLVDRLGNIITVPCPANSFCHNGNSFPCPIGSVCRNGTKFPCPDNLSCTLAPSISYPTKEKPYYVINNPPEYTLLSYQYPNCIIDNGNDTFIISSDNSKSGSFPIIINYVESKFTIYINITVYDTTGYHRVQNLPSTFHVIVAGSAGKGNVTDYWEGVYREGVLPSKQIHSLGGKGGIIQALLTGLPYFVVNIPETDFNHDTTTNINAYERYLKAGSYSSILINDGTNNLIPLIVSGGGGSGYCNMNRSIKYYDASLQYEDSYNKCFDGVDTKFVLLKKGISNENIGLGYIPNYQQTDCPNAPCVIQKFHTNINNSTSAIATNTPYVLDYTFTLTSSTKRYVMVISIQDQNNVFPRPCPDNNYCPSTSIFPLECPAGTICTSGSSIPCPAGSYCPNSYTSVLCPSGTYNKSFGDNSIDSCVPCSTTDGYYCPIGSIEPILCPSGSYCKNGTITTCPETTYSTLIGQNDSNSCLFCPSGSYCTNGIISTCPLGSYCPSKSSKPSICKPGTYNMSTGNSDEKSCTVCPPGSYCINGIKHTCPSGSYCPPNSILPTFCPEGTYSTSTGNIDSNSCIACPAGSFCTKGIISTCPVGSYCPFQSSTPTLCEKGTYTMTTGNSTCLTCPTGFYCPSDLSNYNTISGTYYPTNIKKYSNFNLLDNMINSFPSYMTSGYRWKFTNITNVITPNLFGFSIDSSNSNITIASGPLITYSPQSLNGIPSYKISPIAPKQSFTIDWFNTENKTITFYNFGYNDTMKLFIQNVTIGIDNKGNFTQLTNQSLLSKGWNVTVELYEINKDTKLACPPGSYCPPGSNLPTICPPGSITLESEQSSCISCPSGNYCPKSKVPLPCPSGNYCPTGTIIPKLCPSGYFSNMGQSECTKNLTGFYSIYGILTECPADYYCPPGSRIPLPCPSGTFSFPGQSECIPNPAGQTNIKVITNSNGELNLTAYSCPPGFYCPSGSNPIPCPIGTNSTKLELSQINQCYDSICPIGYFCQGGNIQPRKCDNPGDYCPFGLYGDNLLNSYFPRSAITYCPAGSYCPDSNTKILCPPGTFNSDNGAYKVEQCQPCPPGMYCTEGNISPVMCPLGTFYDNSDLRCVDVCKVSYEPVYAKDWQCNSKGQCGRDYILYHKMVSKCGVGDSPDGWINAANCPVGTTYNPVASALKSLSDCYNYRCPAGYYCPAPSVKTPCPVGYYCPEGSSKPLVCPRGYFCGCGDSPVTDLVNCPTQDAIKRNNQLLAQTRWDSNKQGIVSAGLGNPNLKECKPGCSTYSRCYESFFHDNRCGVHGCYSDNGDQIQNPSTVTIDDRNLSNPIYIYKSGDVDFSKFGRYADPAYVIKNWKFWLNIGIYTLTTILTIVTGGSALIAGAVFLALVLDELLGNANPKFHIAMQSIVIALTAVTIISSIHQMAQQIATSQAKLAAAGSSIRNEIIKSIKNNAETAGLEQLLKTAGRTWGEITTTTMDLIIYSINLSNDLGATIPGSVTQAINILKTIKTVTSGISFVYGSYKSFGPQSGIHGEGGLIPHWVGSTADYILRNTYTYANTGTAPNWYNWATYIVTTNSRIDNR